MPFSAFQHAMYYCGNLMNGAVFLMKLQILLKQWENLIKYHLIYMIKVKFLDQKFGPKGLT